MFSSISSKRDLPARNFMEVTSVDSVSGRLQLLCDTELPESSADPRLLALTAEGSAEFLLKVVKNKDVGFPPCTFTSRLNSLQML